MHKLIFHGLAVLLAFGCTTAGAQGYPTKTVRVVVPFPAGGATDIISRTIAQRVSQNLGQQFVVDNKAGAGGSLGSAEAARAAPDGYTLLITTTSTHSAAPHLVAKLPYDTVADFTPIAHLANAANVLLVNPQLPVKSVAELLAYARARPGQLNYGSSGNGTVVHLTSEAFKAQAGLFITHIPYKGTGAAMTDLAAGNLQLLFDSIPSAMGHVKDGRVRALAVTGLKRSALVPELPTVAEAGLPGFQSVTWFGLYGPKGMSADLAKKIHDEFERAVQSPDVVERLGKLGAEPAPAGSSAQFAAMVQADSERWAKVIKDRKIVQE